MANTPDIKILAGLQGGGSLSGETGQLIQSQLNSIAAELNGKGGLKIKVDVDPGGNKQRVTALQQAKIATEEATRVEKVRALQAKALAAEDARAAAAERQRAAAIKMTAAENQRAQSIEKVSEQQRRKAIASLNLLQAQFPKMAGTQFQTQFDAISQGLKDSTMSGEEANAQVILLRKNMTAAGLAGQTFGQKVKAAFGKFAQYVTVSTIILSAVRSVKQMVSEVKELDKALITLAKVSGVSDTELENYLERAKVKAIELKASLVDLTDAVGIFAKLGYNLPDAEKLGEVAIKFKNVGDDVASIEDSADSIVSAMKAFNIPAQEAERVIDIYNELGNKFAISSGDLSGALQKSASTLVQANNDIAQSSALITASQEIVQNSEVVGTQWKTIALRIRGAKTELEDAGLETDGMVESTSKLREQVKAISGVDIMLDENTFRSTYDIVLELSKVWNDLTDIDQASLLELLAGKRGANVFAAAIQNVDTLKSSYDAAQNSVGSAAAEYERWSQGIEAATQEFSASFEAMSSSVINSDLIKFFVNLGTAITKAFTWSSDTFGALPTLLTVLGGGMLIKNLGSGQNDALHIGLSTYKYAA